MVDDRFGVPFAEIQSDAEVLMRDGVIGGDGECMAPKGFAIAPPGRLAVCG